MLSVTIPRHGVRGSLLAEFKALTIGPQIGTSFREILIFVNWNWAFTSHFQNKCTNISLDERDSPGEPTFIYHSIYHSMAGWITSQLLFLIHFKLLCLASFDLLNRLQCPLFNNDSFISFGRSNPIFFGDNRRLDPILGRVGLERRQREID